nr:armadillo repeat-containing protein 8 [Tanacetum cinerariifolium]
MIYQSKVAPKYDFFEEKNIQFLISLLDRNNENVTGLGASIITHSCQTHDEQKILADAGVLKKLINLLGGTTNQRDASLESFATIIKENPEVISKFVGPENGRTWDTFIELTKDRYPRTRLLACTCLNLIKNAAPSYLQSVGMRTKLILVLLELLDDHGQVGDEALFTLSSFIADDEAWENQPLPYSPSPPSVTYLRSALNFITDALTHTNEDVRVAACICLKNISRSVKYLSAGRFMIESVIMPLIQLLFDPSTSVQVAALCTISNIVVDFTMHKSLFVQNGGVKKGSLWSSEH